MPRDTSPLEQLTSEVDRFAPDGAVRQSGSDGDEARAAPLLPEVQLPKGGGAFKSIGEKLTTDLATGSATFSIPLATTSGRASFGPGLSLTYSTGSGNGPWGIGFQCSPPSISRKTDEGVPRYFDDDHPDTFVLAGAEDLVPVRDLDDDAIWKERLDRDTHWVRRFRPRMEAGFARIEQWVHKNDPDDVHFRVTGADNVIQIFGATQRARISKGRRIFSWLLEETREPKGQAIAYRYKQENGEGIDSGCEAWSRLLTVDDEVVRVDGEPVLVPNAHRYLERIRYGNRTPVGRDDPLPEDPAAWLFELVFDYGEYSAPAWLGPDTDQVPRPDSSAPTQAEAIEPPGRWTVRADPFSDHRAGFERRQLRLCRRVLMYHRMPEHAGQLGVSPCLVRSTDFEYDETPVVTYLKSVTHAGYRWDGHGYLRETLPPILLDYARLDVLHDETKHRPLSGSAGNNPDFDLCEAQGQRPGEEWVDLNGEGLPGLLSRDDVWRYRANSGDGVLRHDAVTTPSPLPSVAADGAQLVDISRDGRPDVVSYDGRVPTYVFRDVNGSWLDPASFPVNGRINIDVRDSRTWLVDLDGNGAPDILQVQGSSLVWYRSLETKGFEPGQSVPLPPDDETGPRVAFLGDRESLFFADMSGDGLLDLVRVSATTVEYWPSLGHAQFGARVSIPLAQPLAPAVEFESRRVRFADVDGAGPSDIVYLGMGGADVHRNESGNRFAAPQRLASFGVGWDPDEVAVVDLLGAGRSCLVWSERRRGGTALQFLDPAGGEKPHLLVRYSNNLGGETRIGYRPSTEDYLRDRRAGRAWATTLPFPVHVVARVERYDRVSRAYEVTTYEYHHGYYDAAEREFRGFAAVDEILEEWTDSVSGSGLFKPRELELDRDIAQLARSRTSTWFHTGAFVGGQQLEALLESEYFDEDGEAPKLSTPMFNPTWSAGEKREAARCLRGSILRREVYAEDGTPSERVPYTVEASTYRVCMLHAGSAIRPAVFFTHLEESLSLHYERNRDDPRTTHALTLAVDDFGNVTRKVDIAYPRRNPAFPEQHRLWATYAESAFSHRPEPRDWYRVSVPSQSSSYEVVGLPNPAAGLGSHGRTQLLSLETVRAYVDDLLDDGARTVEEASGPGYLRLLTAERVCFFSDDLAELPVGEISAMNLSCRTYSLALTESKLAAHVDHNVDGTPAPHAFVMDRAWLTDRGGYVRGSDIAVSAAHVLTLPARAANGWWAPSGSVAWESDQAVVAARFFQPQEARDPFGNPSFVRLDPLALVVTESRNAYGQITAAESDFRTLTPTKTTDPNGASTEVETNAFGLPIKLSVAGSSGEGDSLDSPTIEFEYHQHRWRRDGKPAYATASSKVEHVPGARRERTLVFTNGSGDEAMTKVEAPRGRARRRDPTTGDLVSTEGEPVYDDDVPRWIGSGRVVLNNKGLPVKKYEPYFSSTWDYEDEADLVEAGVTPLLSYDPIGRLVQTEFPDGTLSRVEFDAWTQTTSDPNDLVEGSRWYTDRWADGVDVDEVRAAERSLEHRATPTVVHLDSLGRPFASIAHNKHVRRTPEGTPNLDVDERYGTYTEYDVEGRVVRVSRPRIVGGAEPDLPTLTQRYDFLGRPLHSDSPDAGNRWSLQDAASRDAWSWDGNGNEIEQRYDQLGRPTETWVTNGVDTKLTTLVVYGREMPNPAAHYALGRVFRVYDGAGRLETPDYDFKGNPLRSIRRLATAFDVVPDWRGAPAAPAAGLEPVTSGLESTVAYDALNRPVTEVAPDGSRTRYTYNESGQPVSVHVTRGDVERPYVEGTEYNARGQRVEVRYGNRVITSYEYDPNTFRVRRIHSYHGQTSRQDLRYTYDAAGNVTRIRDLVHGGTGNNLVRTGWEYWYDSLYRLVRTEGREHAGQLPPSQTDWRVPAHSGRQKQPLESAHPNDLQALRNYEEDYFYDPADNIVEKVHHAGGRTSRLRYRYEGQTPGGGGTLDGGIAVSNRLTSTRLPGDALAGAYSAIYTYDSNGNMTDFVGRPQTWDHANRMIGTDLGGGGQAYYTYDADGQRVRKRIVRLDGSATERVYFRNYEVYREFHSDTLAPDFERQSLKVNLTDQLLAMIEQVTREAGTSIDVAERTDRVRFQLADHLRSTRLEISEAQGDFAPRVITYEEHYAYGSTSYRATNSGSEFAWVSADRGRYRYNGKELDSETGLYYYGARYYAAWLTRWTACDPVGPRRSRNLFGYVDANPVVNRDPDGRFKASGIFLEPLKHGARVTGAGGAAGHATRIPVVALGMAALVSVTAAGYIWGRVLERSGQLDRARADTLRLQQQVREARRHHGRTLLENGEIDEEQYRLFVETGSLITKEQRPTAGHETTEPSAEPSGRMSVTGRDTGARAGVSKETTEDVWALDPKARGKAIEKELARTEYRDWYNVGSHPDPFFPLVDFQRGRELVSLKSVDTRGGTWLDRLKTHIDALADAEATVDDRDAEMILDVRVQPGGADDAEELRKHGESAGVEVRIKEFP